MRALVFSISKLVLLGTLLLPAPAFAQITPVAAESPDVPMTPPSLQAVITSDNQVEITRNIIFDSSDTFNPLPDEPLSYRWNFGDRSREETEPEAVHSYKEPGTYTVTLTVSNGMQESVVSKSIIVYSRLILLLTDQSADQTLISNVAAYATSKGQLLQIVGDLEGPSDYLSSESLISQLNTNIKDVRAANTLVMWTGSSVSLGALADFSKTARTEHQLDFSQKTIVFITQSGLSVVGRLAEGTFRIVEPKRIILTRPGGLHSIVDALDAEAITGMLASSGTDFKIVDQVSSSISPLNFMSYLVDYMRNRGVPDNTIFLILVLPLIATIVTFIRQIIGISTAGIYAPAIITISFIALGLWTGILMFVVILLASGLARQLVKHVTLMYIPRMAIVLTITSLAIFLLLLVASYFGIQSITTVSIFPLLILIMMAEKFLNVIVERGTRASFFIMGETLVVAIICYVLVNEWSAFYTFTLAYPEMIFALIILNYLLGRWTGLRLTEYFRFRQILTSVEHAEE